MFENRGYRVAPLTIAEIRQKANAPRRALNIPLDQPFPVLYFTDTLLPQLMPGFSFEIVEDEKMPPNVQAFTIPLEKTLYCRSSVYHDAYRRIGYALGTLAHEIGHIFLHGDQPIAFAKGMKGYNDHEIYEDSEWQANTYERELLIPFKGLNPSMSVEEIAQRYHTSLDLARIAYERFLKEI